MYLASHKRAGHAAERTGPVRFFSSAAFCCTLLLACVAPQAKADFSGYYAISNFNTVQSTFANGFICVTAIPGVCPAATNSTVYFVGPNDGTGVAGETDFTILPQISGLLQFSWAYTTLNLDPTDNNAGYIANGAFNLLTPTNGAFVSVSVSVVASQPIGFAIQTGDNTGEPGILTVSNFSGPLSSSSSAPEPGSLTLALFGIGAAFAARGLWRLRSLRRARAGAMSADVAAIGFTVPLHAQGPYFSTDIIGQLAFQYVVDASHEMRTQP